VYQGIAVGYCCRALLDGWYIPAKRQAVTEDPKVLLWRDDILLQSIDQGHSALQSTLAWVWHGGCLLALLLICAEA
jgi:hypothetical protein